MYYKKNKYCAIATRCNFGGQNKGKQSERIDVQHNKNVFSFSGNFRFSCLQSK